MSGSTNPFPSVEELRRRCAIWSLAIFGSLSGSGVVRLESNVWGAEDPPTEAKSTGEKKAEGEGPKGFDRAAFQQFVQNKQFEEAATMIDAALADEPSPTNLYMNFMLANAMLNAKDPAGFARMEGVAKQASETLQNDSSAQVSIAFGMSHQSLAQRLVSEKKTAEAIELLKNALAKMEGRQTSTQGSLVSMLVTLLVKEGHADEARAIASQRLETAFVAAKENTNTSTRAALGLAFSQFNSTVGSQFPDEAQKAYETIEPMLREAVEADSASVADYNAYQSLQTSLAMSKADTDAATAIKLLETTKEIGNKLAERLEADEQKRMASTLTSLRSAESRIKSKLLHQSLIGQPAPEFDIEAVVNMPKVTWADLKGKVVLIDFWAVWCGPCIATFPHLQEWKEKYGEKGLVIVGVTRQYGYRWDNEQGRQVSEKDAPLEVELEMLEEFRKAYKLEHGFVVSPKESDYNRKFGVTGIPQAVLVDQNGVIQLIRVGSGEKNAEEMEAKIKSLLGV